MSNEWDTLLKQIDSILVALGPRWPELRLKRSRWVMRDKAYHMCGGGVEIWIIHPDSETEWMRAVPEPTADDWKKVASGYPPFMKLPQWIEKQRAKLRNERTKTPGVVDRG